MTDSSTAAVSRTASNPSSAGYETSPVSVAVLRLIMVAVFAAVGLTVAAISFRMARENVHLDAARGLLWLALAFIYAPAFSFVLGRGRTRAEQISAVLICGVSLYAVKILYDPTRLGFPDELIHAANASRIVATGGLFSPNSIAPVSADFPGLPAVAASLAQITHMGIVPSALIVIGFARVLLMLALFLLFEQTTRGDSRLSAIATMLFAANPNYLYWSSQFSYESLSFPLFILVVFCALRRWHAVAADRRWWTIAASPALLLIAITHHMTGMAMAVVLWALVVVARRRGAAGAGPVAMAVVATLATGAWLAFVAPETFAYLGDIFRRAGNSVLDAFTRQGTTRKPFEVQTGIPAPLDAKLLAVLSSLLVVASSITGVRLVARRGVKWPLEPLLVLAALGSIVVYGARVFPDAWETANRASEYVFVGAALMAAVVVTHIVARGGALRRGLPVVAALVAVAGASVTGWPTSAQLPRPFRVQAFGTTLTPEGDAVARWSSGVDRAATYVASDTTGRLLLADGVRHVVGSREPGVPELLKDPTLPAWQWQLLRRHKVDRIVLDQRRFTNDNVIGYYFPRPNDVVTRYSPGVRKKFADLDGVSRVYDSGNVVVYDLGRSLGDAP
jgi:hypothetical protein